MLTPYEHNLLAVYLANTVSGLSPDDWEAYRLIDCITDEENRVVFPHVGHRWRGKRRSSISAERGFSTEDLCRLEDSLRDMCPDTAVEPGRTTRRLRCLGEATGLDRVDLDILELLLLYQTQAAFKWIIKQVFLSPGLPSHPLNLAGRAMPLLLGLSTNTIQDRLQSGAPLVRTGLVAVDGDGNPKTIRRLRQLVTAPGDSDIDVTHLLLDVASSGDLEWSDFDHAAGDRDHVEMLARGALDSGAPGVNILLHGPPGTGKTEFCKVLARRLGVTLYSVGETDEDGDEPSRTERLQEFKLAQHLLANNRRSLLLFDEMEDLLEGSSWNYGVMGWRPPSQAWKAVSKVFMHRLLEQVPVPTLWTMNDARGVNPAILRRMMFAFELRPPPAGVRERVWARQLGRHGIEAEPHEVHALATEFDATPGVAAGATAAARLGGGDIATVRRGVKSLSRLLSCGKPPQRTPAGFDLGLIQADVDPSALAARLADGDARSFSILLQGPPGTGKSAFVRYLAERLGLEVVQKRASDLMSMWVGETERQIADAFAEARDTNAFLVFDEADSLVGDRRFAQRNWEVSQVNEMLTWMESHPLPFACTTNFGDHLDPATLRRFVFKIALDYLEPAQAAAAFRSYFDLPPPPSLAGLAALTPGDFAVVRRKAELLGRLQEPEALSAMLRAECDAKPDRPQTIGF